MFNSIKFAITGMCLILLNFFWKLGYFYLKLDRFLKKVSHCIDCQRLPKKLCFKSRDIPLLLVKCLVSPRSTLSWTKLILSFGVAKVCQYDAVSSENRTFCALKGKKNNDKQQ